MSTRLPTSHMPLRQDIGGYKREGESPYITAVMVTCNPPEGLENRVAAILNQADALVIVDNGSADTTTAQLKALEAQYQPRITCIFNASNIGLAAALNQGIRQARKFPCEWVLLFDHDSRPEDTMLSAMLGAYHAYPNKREVGLVAPRMVDDAAPPTKYLALSGAFGFERSPLLKEVDDTIAVVITSGSLIPVELFDDIGLMPEHFFIDYIDYDFCLRLLKRKYKILLVKKAVLHHSVGEKKQHIGFITTSNHSARRRFTIFRNRVWLWKRYGLSFPGFAAHDALAACFDVFRVLTLEANKLEKLKAIFQGLAAGIRKEPK